MPDGTAKTLDTILYALSYNKELIAIDWNEVAEQNAVKHAKNARASFKEAVEKDGNYVFTKKDRVMTKASFEDQEADKKAEEAKKKQKAVAKGKKRSVRRTDEAKNITVNSLASRRLRIDEEEDTDEEYEDIAAGSSKRPRVEELESTHDGEGQI